MNLALFDLDGTLIAKDSDHAFGEFLVDKGWADGVEFKQGNDRFYADYLAGTLDMQAYVAFATAPWRRRSQQALDVLIQDFMAQRMEALLTPQARDLVQRHLRQGDKVAIVTATNEVVTRPIATALGVAELIATQLERDGEGRATGKIQGVPSFREGKITRVVHWLGLQGLERSALERCTFYSDSTNDLPLLEAVRHPVATNPSPALERIALDRGWPILRLFT